METKSEQKMKQWEHKLENWYEQADWKAARKFLKRKFLRYPENYWIVSEIGSTYYEEKRYKKALKWFEKAIEMNADDPYLRWNWACGLDMNAQQIKSVPIYEKLIQEDIKKLAFEYCSEGLAWAKSLINDCRYRLALAYWDLGQKDLFAQYLLEHKKHRKGIKSIYSKKEVETHLQRIAA